MCVCRRTCHAQSLSEAVHNSAKESHRQWMCFADLSHSLSVDLVSGAVVVTAAAPAAAVVLMPPLTLQVLEQRKRGVLTRQQMDAVAQAVPGVCVGWGGGGGGGGGRGQAGGPEGCTRILLKVSEGMRG